MDVKLPNLGEGADSGTVVSVLVKAGATVKKGQNVIELETGKAVAPIPAPAAGTVSRVAVKEGDKISVGQLILVLEGGRKEPEAPKAEGAGKAEVKTDGGGASKSDGGRKGRRPRPEAEMEEEAPDGGEGEGGGEWKEAIVNENPAAGPYVRRVARDLGIDLRTIRGTGRSGQVGVGDLKAYVARLRALAGRPRKTATGRPAPAVVSIDFEQWGPVERKPMSALRKTIAERMVESASTLPTVTQFDDADVTALMDMRKRYAGVYEERGARLTLTTFVLRAVTGVLRRHPLLNASLDEATNEVVLKGYIHLGLAVDTEAGLLVPVIRDADRKDLVALSKEVQELAGKARERKLRLAEMQGGTFTISNQGGIGGAHFTPIVNKPEVAILGLGRSAPRAVVRDGSVTVRTMMPLALTYDHRLIDGGLAARFMVDLVAALEGFSEEDIRL
ncbi:MAG: 2-oxo acid dehydrogenase subunit E2 [Verrucomicrobiae bacterium]|nr:2-oxo acid dehydrogenase subunit E2 [Verrucomicrobiae bacterium]